MRQQHYTHKVEVFAAFLKRLIKWCSLHRDFSNILPTRIYCTKYNTHIGPQHARTAVSRHDPRSNFVQHTVTGQT